ncbi:MAG: excinuclease ABC subunit UvrC [Bacillota bacterium]|nr:excinuclease ABC subunit UvrC [Bacillota bacterium]
MPAKRVEPVSLEERAKQLPEEPGVYLFKDGTGDVIYVGKAISLRDRVKSYFQSPRNLTAKTLTMVQQAQDVDYIVVESEVEALILESNLIKKHRPKYNVRLKDDKHYPYLRVTTEETWPRVLIARAIKQDGSRYFGPYTRSGAVSETMQLIRRIFPLRTCSNNVFRTVSRPCLNYHIQRCLGPCKVRVTPEEYGAMVKDICLFLEGRPEVLRESTRKRMKEASESLEFERAAKLRDQLKAIEEITQKQKIISSKAEDRDAAGVALAGPEAVVVVLQVREGKMIGAEQLYMSGPPSQTTEDVIGGFLTQYYPVAADLPDEILLPAEPEDAEVVAGWLGKLAKHKVMLRAPVRGKAKQLVQMATRNALLALEELKPKAERDRERATKGLEELAGVLGLPRPPARIECYDISNIQGTNATGSMVVFEDGFPKKDDYRRFKIRTVEGANDFAMLAEVIGRRFKRAAKAQKDPEATAQGSTAQDSFAHMPDLVVVDGGKGQLSSAIEALSGAGIAVPAIGLAKKEEEVFTPGSSDPLQIPKDSDGLMLLQRIRDEAHRFAVGYHRKIRSHETRRSILDEIPGIGPKRRVALLKAFGSIRAISEASVQDLTRVKGMNEPAARRVLAHLSAATEEREER